MTTEFLKDPDATMDYTIDWSTWLAPGDSLVTATWALPTGITQGATSLFQGKATVFVSGGTSGQVYTVACRITTAQGRTDDRSISLRVQQR